MPTLFNHYPNHPANALCDTSFVILCNTHDTASSFLETFNAVRANRHARGAPTDEEQDLLRAMFTFANSGLDSLVKQLTRDTLAAIIGSDAGANDMFKTFVERRIKREEGLDNRLIADVLCDENPRNKLITILIEDLTSQSLQSTDQLLRVGGYFNIPSNQLTQNPHNLSQIFTARNQIVHEMDIDFSQPNRSRRPRARQTMIDFTNEIFRVANTFLTIVDGKLPV
jgi:hypothetical protein